MSNSRDGKTLFTKFAPIHLAPENAYEPTDKRVRWLNPIRMAVWTVYIYGPLYFSSRPGITRHNHDLIYVYTTEVLRGGATGVGLNPFFAFNAF
jgi:hypothetical protein